MSEAETLLRRVAKLPSCESPSSPPITCESPSPGRDAFRFQTRSRAAPDSVEVVLVHLETDAGITGLGFTYLLGPGAAAVRSLIDTELSPLVMGEDPRETDRLLAKAEARFRGVGFAGLAARAYSGDRCRAVGREGESRLACRSSSCSAAREPAAEFIVSDIAVSGRDAAEVVKLAKPLLKQGAMGVRVEIGGGDVQADADRVREISDGLGRRRVGRRRGRRPLRPRHRTGAGALLRGHRHRLVRRPDPRGRRDRLRETRGVDGNAARGWEQSRIARGILPRDPRGTRPHDPPRSRVGSAASRRF